MNATRARIANLLREARRAAKQVPYLKKDLWLLDKRNDELSLRLEQVTRDNELLRAREKRIADCRIDDYHGESFKISVRVDRSALRRDRDFVQRLMLEAMSRAYADFFRGPKIAAGCFTPFERLGQLHDWMRTELESVTSAILSRFPERSRLLGLDAAFVLRVTEHVVKMVGDGREEDVYTFLHSLFLRLGHIQPTDSMKLLTTPLE